MEGNISKCLTTTITIVATAGVLGSCAALYSIKLDKEESTFKQSLIALTLSDILFLILILISNTPGINFPDLDSNLFEYNWLLRNAIICFQAYIIMHISIESLLAVYKPIH